MMSLMDMLTMSVAALSAAECVVGRLSAMELAKHRSGVMVAYLAAACVCMLAASMLWQGLDAKWLDASAWLIGLHLAVTWRAWRHGAPLDALRQHAEYRHSDMQSSPDSGKR